MKSEPLSKQKFVSEDQLRAWCVLGESPLLYAYARVTTRRSWMYLWQLRNGVFWYATRDDLTTFRPAASALGVIISARKYSLEEIPDAAE